VRSLQSSSFGTSPLLTFGAERHPRISKTLITSSFLDASKKEEFMKRALIFFWGGAL
jgi:hypothetical protein